LEKPGATTTAELQAMEALAKEKNVSVFMGFNRNFSKYVRLAHDFMGTKDASLTLLRNDCFNSEESLDECFERNAEGMMKNMMCHELMVLIAYYGLKVDSIQKVVPDKSYTVKQTRRGFQDFTRVGFTLILKSGQEFTLRGDRQGGEHAEATVSLSGQKFTAMRPDPEILATSKTLEEACPGCMPYFYLQDGEYIDLKQQVVTHVLNGETGSPEGVASISHAIECLKLCDFITEALNA
jgi:predicted dehydrogenase